MTTKIFTRSRGTVRALRSKRGQSLVEYALILSFISVSAVALCSIMGAQIHHLLLNIVNALKAASAGI